MLARWLKFLSVVFYFRSIPAKESRNGDKKQNKKKGQTIGAETKQQRKARNFTVIT